MKKIITVKEFCKELVARIDASNSIECCAEEIKNLASLASAKMGNEQIEVNWKE